MTTHRFDAVLERPDIRGAWTFIRMPFSVPEAKRPAARERRAARSVEMLTEGRRLKS